MSVKCGAVDCSHNASGSCFAGAISVQGNHAHSTPETACCTYSPASGYNAEFASEFGIVQHQTVAHNIQCNAANCKFNTNFSCHADSVKINANTASCETFED